MIIKREIIDASFEIIKRYKSSNKIDTIEMTFRFKDEDEPEIKTVKENINNISFANDISFYTLFFDEKFLIKNSRALKECEIITNLTNMCFRMINYKFKITKVNKYKFSKELEYKFLRHLNKKEDYLIRVLKNHIEFDKYVNLKQKYVNDVLIYYLSRRVKVVRQAKLKKIIKSR